MDVLEVFHEKFRVNELRIFETKHWIWSLRPAQVTLGSGILSLKRPCLEFSLLQQKEFSDLNNLIKVVEFTLTRAFNYDVMNYLMLMMVDKHVHFHVIPRYSRTIDRFNIAWRDKCWPGIHDLVGEPSDTRTLNQICSYIKTYIPTVKEDYDEEV